VGRWHGASLAAAQGEIQGETLFMLVTADYVFGEGGLDPLLAAGAPAVLIDPAPEPARLGGGDPGAGGGRCRDPPGPDTAPAGGRPARWLLVAGR
jgi:hypothetical protein